MKKENKVGNNMLIGMIAAGVIAGVVLTMIFSDAQKDKESESSLSAMKRRLRRLIQIDTTESYLEAAALRDAIKQKEAQNV